MPLNEKLFLIVPLIATLCNAFLFLTVLTAKKNRLIYSFLALLVSFTAWTAGALFMRLLLYPGIKFWYEVSVAGIFSVPFLAYQFIYYFTNQKGTFTKNIWLIGSVIMLILNFMDVFIAHPMITNSQGEPVFEFTIRWSIIFPILFAACTFISAGHLVYRSIKRDGIPARQFTPLLIGLIIMFSGTMLDVVPGLGSLPNDTLACGINSVCIYYALYKRRIITLTHVTSKSPTYLIAAILTTIILASSFRWVDTFYIKNFNNYIEYKTLVFTVLFSLLTMIICQIIVRLINNLFLKGQVSQEAELKKFSVAVSETLALDEILAMYKEFIKDNVACESAYICTQDSESSFYRVAECTNDIRLKTFTLSEDNPLVKWLCKYKRGVTYSDFRRTSSFKCMWETEKQEFMALGIDYILPILCNDSLVAITFFVPKFKKKAMTFAETNFLESVAAILSISIKNACLYDIMKNEARLDALTNLYNRRYFGEEIKHDFALCKHDSLVLIILDLDDFNLFNELYGTQEGDSMLKQFADIITAVIGKKGTICRYSGKVFAVSIPFCDTSIAYQYTLRIKELLKHFIMSTGEKTKKFLTFSAGICAYPASAYNLTELITNTNMAVYRAKKNGKNQIVIYAGNQSNVEVNLTSKQSIGENYASTIYALTAAIDAKDHYTFSHSTNVSEYGAILAEHIRLDNEHVEIIRQAGLLHDIGKIGIPESILSKKTRLTQEEYEIMKQHVESSIAIIRHLPSLDYVIPVAIGHHERWDGRGYPRGLSGEDIPIGARCLSLADSFDAMVSKRSYKEPFSVEDALSEIERNLGKQFDPKLGPIFIQLVRDGKIMVKNEVV